MNGVVYVALGGAIGASCRHLLGIAAVRVLGSSFPYGTMIANIFGSLIMGVLIGWMALKVSGGTNLRLFLAVGLLGGFTTFSSFSLDAILMFERKAYIPMTAYVFGSVLISLSALMIGLYLSRKIFAL